MVTVGRTGAGPTSQSMGKMSSLLVNNTTVPNRVLPTFRVRSVEASQAIGAQSQRARLLRRPRDPSSISRAHSAARTAICPRRRTAEVRRPPIKQGRTTPCPDERATSYTVRSRHFDTVTAATRRVPTHQSRSSLRLRRRETQVSPYSSIACSRSANQTDP